LIHHLTFDVQKHLLVKEIEFWSCLGWNPTGLRRRTRKQPPINWLVCGGEKTAIELIAVDAAMIQGVGHTCIELGQRRYEITTQMLARFQHEFQPHHSWKEHGFALSPTGHTIEIAANLQGPKAGPPLEEA
jgi:hypothetical protein